MTASRFRTSLVLCGLLFSQAIAEPLESAPAEVLYDRALFDIEIIQPWYRNTLYSTQPDKTVILRIARKAEVLAKRPITVELLDPDGKALKKAACIVEGDEARFDGSELAPGSYRLRARVPGPAGKGTLTRTVPLRVLPAAKNEVYFDRDGICYVNGRKFFPRGLYQLSDMIDKTVNRSHEKRGLEKVTIEHAFAEARKKHFNTAVIWTWKKDSPYVDLAAKHGMMAIRSAHASPGEWEKVIERFKDHPALLAWATMDEPHERNLFKQGRDMYAWINEHDPYHPIQMAQCYSDMYAATAAMCDILSPDHYPFNVDPWWQNTPWWKDRYKSPTRITTRLYEMTRSILGPNRPLWPVVQIHGGDRPVKLPEPKHIRLQIYQALIAGARGMLFYAYVCPDTPQGDRLFWVENHPEIWNAVGKLNQELIDLEPVLLAPGGQVLKCKGEGNAAADIRAMVRPIGEEACLFVVNIDAHPQAGTLTLPEGYVFATRWFDKDAPAKTIQDDQMTVELAPWGSQVWRLKR